MSLRILGTNGSGRKHLAEWTEWNGPERSWEFWGVLSRWLRVQTEPVNKTHKPRHRFRGSLKRLLWYGIFAGSTEARLWQAASDTTWAARHVELSIMTKRLVQGLMMQLLAGVLFFLVSLVSSIKVLRQPIVGFAHRRCPNAVIAVVAVVADGEGRRQKRKFKGEGIAGL